nr:MAG TPA: hypothetical protein [Caudoviricetes sp.]
MVVVCSFAGDENYNCVIQTAATMLKNRLPRLPAGGFVSLESD